MQDTELSVESEYVLRAISHELRRKMLFLIRDNTSQSYTELLRKLWLSTGKLNFHLKQLTGIIEKQEDGFYVLTKIGEQAVNILEQINSMSENKEQVEILKKISISTSLKQFNPAPEIKRKWYFWAIVIYLFAIWCPVIVTVSVLDLNFLNVLQTGKASLRILANDGVLTGIILLLIFLTCFLLAKYHKTISYEILDTEIAIVKGLFVKTRAIIPFRTITNLVIKQGPIDLLLGISEVIIQTAGESAKAEAEGKIVGMYYAEDLIEEILNLVRLLDPPTYLRDKVPLTKSPKNITAIYSQILSELQKIDEKLTE
ncbi:MAG: PH domain-containing protein [Asgard group archaeon]|nr:PH domain-containing protein [Asgard group archaeon]